MSVKKKYDETEHPPPTIHQEFPLTRILAQASCVDSVPLSSLISIEPRYCKETTKNALD